MASPVGRLWRWSLHFILRLASEWLFCFMCWGVLAGLVAWQSAKMTAFVAQLGITLAVGVALFLSVGGYEETSAFRLIRYKASHDAPLPRAAVIGIDGGDWSVIDVIDDEWPTWEAVGTSHPLATARPERD